MLENTVLIALSDNGGDWTTGASNHPYRGTKMTPWEGGTRVAAFVSSTNAAYVPVSSRGASSYSLAHVTDLFPSICHLAHCDARATETGPMDGTNVWDALVTPSRNAADAKSPRTSMVYNIDPLGLGAVAGGFAAGRTSGGAIGAQKALNSQSPRRLVLHGNVPETYGAIRVGKWKLIEGVAGRGDWYGSDPAAAWNGGQTKQYIMGPDVTDYSMVDQGGRLGDMRLGDGGQAAVAKGADFDASIKALWLFDLESDPTETTDLSVSMPHKVAELRAALGRERKRMAEPLLLQAVQADKHSRRLAFSEVRKLPDGRAVVGSWADAPERRGDGALEAIIAKRDRVAPQSKL